MNTVSPELFGKSQKVLKAISIARNVSVTKTPVLIVGEIGVGKRTLAKFIHEESLRREGPLLYVDCSHSAQNVENEILGFRNAEGRFNKGHLENGHGGTVILANIDGLDESFQKRLHQILLELTDYDLDVRVIATTPKNLSKLVGSGHFYRGFFTYLASNAIQLPPLRERIEDIEIIAIELMSQINKDMGRVINLDKDAVLKLVGHYWTHNIEELKTILINCCLDSGNDTIVAEDLLIGEQEIGIDDLLDEENNDGIRLMSLKDAERLLIKKALIHTSENRTQAAKILGVSIRTLRNKINEYRSNGNSYFVNLR